MPSDVIKKIEKTVEKYRMLNIRERVIVAVSGGPDSMALLGAMRHLLKIYELTLIVVHFNHGLRAERADEEEIFVHQVSESMGLICESVKSDIGMIRRERRKSIEETAREERFRFFERVRRQYHAHRIALGHHSHDQAETVMMNLLRGSGPEGLKGMLPVREGMYIRPLIELTRDEIMTFLLSQRLPFMIDASNADDCYLRNRIRHHLLPGLKADYNPRLEENLCHTAEILRLEDDFLQMEVNRICADRKIVKENQDNPEIGIRIPAFLCLHEAVQNRLIKHLLLKYTKTRQGIGYIHIMAVRMFIQRSHPSGSLHLPFSIELRREYDMVVIGRRKQPPRRILPAGHDAVGTPEHLTEAAVTPFSYDVNIPCKIDLREGDLSLHFDFVDRTAVRFDCHRTVFMDYDRIVLPLTIRSLQPGDRMQPLGMATMKKLKNEFVDRKIPVRIRKQFPLLADTHSVLWMIGHMLSERVKITDKTIKILKIEMI